MIDLLTIVLVLAGCFFFFATTIGVLRFPDFYTRMHAAGKGDTLASLLTLTGLALYNLHHLSGNDILVSLKIMLIIMFIFLASPTATHAILDAGFESGVQPWTKKGKKEDNGHDMAT